MDYIVLFLCIAVGNGSAFMLHQHQYLVHTNKTNDPPIELNSMNFSRNPSVIAPHHPLCISPSKIGLGQRVELLGNKILYLLFY